MTAFATGFGTGPAPRFDAPYLAWNTVASYSDREGAQRAVDHLADVGFPVQSIDIVGSDLRTVERVTGRLTRRRAALLGATGGIWVGLLSGMVVGLVTGALAFGLLIGVVLGMAWGAAVAFSRHGKAAGPAVATARTVIALRYDVVVRDGNANGARQALDDAGMR